MTVYKVQMRHGAFLNQLLKTNPTQPELIFYLIGKLISKSSPLIDRKLIPVALDSSSKANSEKLRASFGPYTPSDTITYLNQNTSMCKCKLLKPNMSDYNVSVFQALLKHTTSSMSLKAPCKRSVSHHGNHDNTRRSHDNNNNPLKRTNTVPLPQQKQKQPCVAPNSNPEHVLTLTVHSNMTGAVSLWEKYSDSD
eukprot:sb/3470929/